MQSPFVSEAAVHAQPEWTEAQNQLDCCCSVRNAEGAVAAFLTCLGAADNPDAHNNLGIALIQAGRQ